MSKNEMRILATTWQQIQTKYMEEDGNTTKCNILVSSESSYNYCFTYFKNFTILFIRKIYQAYDPNTSKLPNFFHYIYYIYEICYNKARNKT